jgi:hypothetical protein
LANCLPPAPPTPGVVGGENAPSQHKENEVARKNDKSGQSTQPRRETHRVANMATASALIEHWKQYGVTVAMRKMGPYVELITQIHHPMWREINDAFVAGRVSMSN